MRHMVGRPVDEGSFSFRLLCKLEDEAAELEGEMHRLGRGSFTAVEWKERRERLEGLYTKMATAANAL